VEAQLQKRNGKEKILFNLYTLFYFLTLPQRTANHPLAVTEPIFYFYLIINFIA